MSGWERIAVDLTRPRDGYARAVWLMRAGALAVLLAGTVVGSAALLPLQKGEPRVDPVDVGGEHSDENRVRAIRAGTGDAELVMRLGSAYLFTSGRTPALAAGGGSDGTEEQVQSPVVADRSDRSGADQDEAAGLRVIRVESLDDVGEVIRDSFKQLILRGIHSTRRGDLVALIDFTGGRVEQAALRVAAGQSFTEPKNASAPWRVVAVDPERNRVVVEREGRRLALALFGTGPADRSPLVIQPEGARLTERVDVSEDGTIIVRMRPDEAVAQLRREVGAAPEGQRAITLEDLAELLEVLRELDRYGEREREEREQRGRPD